MVLKTAMQYVDEQFIGAAILVPLKVLVDICQCIVKVMLLVKYIQCFLHEFTIAAK